MTDYALYKGEKFIDLGSKKYLAELLGVKEDTIYFYTTPTYRKRSEHIKDNDRLIVIKIEEESEGD